MLTRRTGLHARDRTRIRAALRSGACILCKGRDRAAYPVRRTRGPGDRLMRSGTEFTSAYRKALESVDPSTQGLEIERIRSLAQTELCLAFLEHHLPDESIRTVPFLMMGYPKLLDCACRAETETALATIRHLCTGFGSVSAWLDATAQYQRTTETIRCYDIATGRAIKRKAAPEVVHVLLARRLATPVGWTERKLQIADPGEGVVLVDRGRQEL